MRCSCKRYHHSCALEPFPANFAAIPATLAGLLQKTYADMFMCEEGDHNGMMSAVLQVHLLPVLAVEDP